MNVRSRLRRKRVLIPGLSLATGAFVWFLLPLLLPLPPDLTENPAASPILRDRHNRPLRHLVLPDSTRSAPVALDQIPADLIACTLAAEDKRFHSHGGIDLLATLRAIKDALLQRQAASGASTITQQLVKLSSPRAPRTLSTKLREALVARHLEMKWSKDLILTAYLNHLPYGNQRTGPAEAARFYFQKPLGDLSLAECALLAGLPQAPSRLDPLKHPDRARARRSVVLDRVAANYDASRISAARAESIRLRPLPEETLAPWLPGFIETHGRLTLDADLQHDLEAIVREELDKLSHSNLSHAALVVLDNSSREILALVSSGDWHDPRGGQINGALVPRSPGSALKPFTWLLGFEKAGLHPGSIVADIPTRFRTEEGLDAPENYDRSFRGPVSVREALACSLNVPAMRVLNELGGPRPLHQLLLDLGLDSIGPDPAPYGLGLTLGNAPVRLLDLTNAYATLAESGVHRATRLWIEGENATDHATPKSEIDPPPSIICQPSSAYLIADILADPLARAPSFGRGGPLELPFRCAAKTGTSSDFRDNWCLGFTAEFSVGVWAGNFDNSPMKGLSGVAGAGPIFHRAMLRLHRGRSARWLTRPDGLIDVALDPSTGKNVGEIGQRKTQGIAASIEAVPNDRIPLTASPADRDTEGRVLLDSSYQEWLGSPHNRRRTEFALAEHRPAEQALRILGPRDGSVCLLDPELPNGGLLHLSSNLPKSTRWSSPTLKVFSGGTEAIARLEPGSHILTATDLRNGHRKQVTIHVKPR